MWRCGAETSSPCTPPLDPPDGAEDGECKPEVAHSNNVFGRDIDVLGDGQPHNRKGLRESRRASRGRSAPVREGFRRVRDVAARLAPELWEPSSASLHLDRWLDVSLSWPSSTRRSDGQQGDGGRLWHVRGGAARVRAS